MSLVTLNPLEVIVEPPAEYSVTVTETIALPPVEVQIQGIQGAKGEKGDKGDDANVEPISNNDIALLFGVG